MFEWIKTEDKRPEDEQLVLVTVKKGTYVLGQLSRNAVYEAIFYENGEQWCPYFQIVDCSDQTKLTGEVIAWAPLPEPFEEVQA